MSFDTYCVSYFSWHGNVFGGLFLWVIQVWYNLSAMLLLPQSCWVVFLVVARSSISIVMDSQENQPQPHPTQSLNFKLKSSVFYVSSILILVLAISFSFTKSNFLKPQHLKYTFSVDPTLFQTILEFIHWSNKTIQTQEPEPISLPRNCVLWMAPFLSGVGYSSEGWSYILSLHEQNRTRSFRIAIEQHGDLLFAWILAGIAWIYERFGNWALPHKM